MKTVEVSTYAELLRLNPSFLRSLAQELGVLALHGRVCPVAFTDDTVGVFAHADYCRDDQTIALFELLKRRGLRLNAAGLYILPPALLLAIDKPLLDPLLIDKNLATDRFNQGALCIAFDDLLLWGLENNASDIHFNVKRAKHSSSVFYTIAGRYVSPEQFAALPTSTVLEMLSVAWMGIEGGNGAVFDPLVEQQGRLTRVLKGRQVLLRWASLATDLGPSVCLRVLAMDDSGLTPDLKALGYLPAQIRLFEQAQQIDGGAVLLAGTVGSGKSTTIATLMRAISSDRKVITLEDPVEYLIPNALQNTVCRSFSAQDDYAFDTKLKVIKRSAMNDLLMGEIRDQSSGRAFMDLAVCGVNLYSTVHAGSALLIPDRLASSFIGVARELLATPGVLKLLVFQALLKKLCANCSLDADQVRRRIESKGLVESAQRDAAFERWLRGLEAQWSVSRETLRFQNTQGCEQCVHAIQALNGTKGRTVVAEMIDPLREPEFLQGIKEQDGLGLYRWFRRRCEAAASDDTSTQRSVQQMAIVKMKQGVLDPYDIQARFGAYPASEPLVHRCL